MENSFDWNDLKYLLACSRAGSLAGAGRALKVDQTTVGRRLNALEQSLGARLFDRTSDGFVLTTTGEQLIAQSEVIEQGTIDIARRAVGEDVRLEGVVQLATTQTIASCIAPFLVGLHEEHPGITLEILTATSASNLLRREADLALRVGARPTQQSLIVRKLGTVSFGLFISRERKKPRRGEPSKGDSLVGQSLIGYSEELAPSPAGKWIDKNAGDAQIVFRTNSFDVARTAARVGWGIACLPRFLGDQDPGLVRFRPETFSPQGMWTVVHSDLQRSSRVRAVMEHLVGAVDQAKLLD